MTLNQYIESLQKINKKYGNLEVWYAADDEGNAYYPVSCLPSVQDVKDIDINTDLREGKIVLIN